MSATDEIRWEDHLREHDASKAELDRRFGEANHSLDIGIRGNAESTRIALEAAQAAERAHAAAHQREHGMTETALSKAENAATLRFEAVNAFREQLREQATHFATNERLDALLQGSFGRTDGLSKEMDRRADEVAKRDAIRAEEYAKREAIVLALITDLQKQNIGVEGRTAGTAATRAVIVAAIGLVVTAISGIGLVIGILAK